MTPSRIGNHRRQHKGNWIVANGTGTHTGVTMKNNYRNILILSHVRQTDIHGYNTRSRNKLHIPKTNHNFAQNNLRYRIIQTLNKLPVNVIRKLHTHSIYGLTSYAKKYFISNYKTECTIENCYICQCSMR